MPAADSAHHSDPLLLLLAAKDNIWNGINAKSPRRAGSMFC
jgi:hypothetical protein